MGRRGRSRVDDPLAGALPHLRNPARGEVTRTADLGVTAKAKTALILASIAAAFFIGVVIRHWLW
ncbi:MAG: cytochrome oxidase small assembly protein [Burkholderiales bacterium]